MATEYAFWDTRPEWKDGAVLSYTIVHAAAQQKSCHEEFDRLLASGVADAEARHRAKGKFAAGKYFGFFDGSIEEVVHHVQWEHRSRHSYFSRLPEHAIRVGSAASVGLSGSTVCTEHALAAERLVDCINAKRPIRFSSKCSRGTHIVEVFQTDDSMHAIRECTMLNYQGRKIRLDVAIQRNGATIFGVEILFSHRSVPLSRTGVAWVEVLASHVLAEIADENACALRITCEPRPDIQVKCTRCDKEEQQRKIEQCLAAEREAETRKSGRQEMDKKIKKEAEIDKEEELRDSCVQLKESVFFCVSEDEVFGKFNGVFDAFAGDPLAAIEKELHFKVVMNKTHSRPRIVHIVPFTADRVLDSACGCSPEVMFQGRLKPWLREASRPEKGELLDAIVKLRIALRKRKSMPC